MKKQKRKQAGLSLIEVLVVVAVLGLLAGLLLNAVQASRETARRAQCMNNLRQIGLALQHYAGRERTFPAGYSMPGDRPGGKRLGLAYSAFVRILADLDQPQLFDAVNFESQQETVRSPNPQHVTVAATHLSVFVCPSDGSSLLSDFGLMNYRVNTGSSFRTFPKEEDFKNRGPFTYVEWNRPSSIRDGLSTTAMVSERLRGDGRPERWDRRRDPWAAGLRVSMSRSQIVERCQAAPRAPVHASNAGHTWFIANYLSSLYNHVVEPNSQVPDCLASTGDQYLIVPLAGAGIHAARSDHPGGVNVVMGDGSVRFVRSSIDRELWRAIGTRAGGEVVSLIEN